MRILALSLLLIVLALQYRLWLSDGGMREVWRLKTEVTTQTALNDTLKERNRTLSAEVQDLKKGTSAIEERARTDLGLTGNNETFFQVVPKTIVPTKPTTLMAAHPASDDSEPKRSSSTPDNTTLKSSGSGGLTVSASQ